MLKHNTILAGKKIEKTKLNELFLALGVVIPDCALTTIYILYGKDGNKILDTPKFCAALEEGDIEDPNVTRMKAANFSPLSVKDCEITAEILADYDSRMLVAVQAVFDVFDKNGTNKISSSELERMLCSLGLSPSPEDLGDLIYKTDRKASGFIDYTDFVTHIIPFIRKEYRVVSKVSVVRYKLAFDALDVNGDGSLQPGEFRHIINTTLHEVKDSEMEALVAYLDVDKSGSIDWTEFQRMVKVAQNEKTLIQLPEILQRIIRKIQYAFLPDPYKCLNMFNGIPINYRLSVLAPISKLHSLEEVICPTKFNVKERSPATDISFEFQVVKCVGVPSESESRRGDVVSRYARFSLCYTDKAPTAEEPGSPPVFLGNVTTLHAAVHPSYLDKWIFSNKDELDADVSCFATCSTVELDVNKEITTKNEEKPSLDKIHVFIELISTIRVKPFRGAVVTKDRLRSGSASRTSVEDDLPELKAGGENVEENSGEETVVDLCAGWSIIPVATVLKGGRKQELEMRGGTPFAVVAINSADVAVREGYWQMIKRAAGRGPKNTMTILITPRDYSTADASSLFQCLPINIVIPSSSVTMVAIYRKLLKEAHEHRLATVSNVVRHTTDAIFSSFPRILADPAASRVMLYLWSKEAPADVVKAAGFKSLSEADVSTRALQVFRDIVLRVYRAFNSPDSIPSRLKPEESAEDIDRREQTMRGIVGVNPAIVPSSLGTLGRSMNLSSFRTFGASQALNTSNVSADAANASLLGSTRLMQIERLHREELVEHTYTPFNARELMWKPTNGNIYS